MEHAEALIVLVNGEPTRFETAVTLATALTRFAIDAATRGVAVAVDDEVVPRSEWAATPLRGGARIDIVRAVQGG